MNTLDVIWRDDGIGYSLGTFRFLNITIQSRLAYNGHKRPRNTAIYCETSGFFTAYNPATVSMSWKEGLNCLRSLGFNDDEVRKFVHLGVVIGWSDIDEVQVWNGQETLPF